MPLLQNDRQQQMRRMLKVVIGLVAHRFARTDMVRHMFGVCSAGDADRQIETCDVDTDAMPLPAPRTARSSMAMIGIVIDERTHRRQCAPAWPASPTHASTRNCEKRRTAALKLGVGVGIDR
jgi:hypothetical protein